jgi:hypothetical protein
MIRILNFENGVESRKAKSKVEAGCWIEEGGMRIVRGSLPRAVAVARGLVRCSMLDVHLETTTFI